MNPMQLAYFRNKLEIWRAQLLNEATETITDLSQENLHRPDQMDRAQIESNAAIDLRTRDRERKLLQKIEAALRRIEDGSYGYCVETDEPINLRRLEARPIASLSLHAHRNSTNGTSASTATTDRAILANNNGPPAPAGGTFFLCSHCGFSK